MGATVAAGVAATSSSALTDDTSKFPIKLKAMKLDATTFEHFLARDMISFDDDCDFIDTSLLEIL